MIIKIQTIVTTITTTKGALIMLNYLQIRKRFTTQNTEGELTNVLGEGVVHVASDFISDK